MLRSRGTDEKCGSGDADAQGYRRGHKLRRSNSGMSTRKERKAAQAPCDRRFCRCVRQGSTRVDSGNAPQGPAKV
jgi:hypothetical protein